MRSTLAPIGTDQIRVGDRLRFEGTLGLTLELTVQGLLGHGRVQAQDVQHPVNLNSGTLYRIEDPWEPYLAGYVAGQGDGALADRGDPMDEDFDGEGISAEITAHHRAMHQLIKTQTRAHQARNQED